MTEKLLNINEASEVLGIPVGSLRNMVCRREIPFVRAGNRRVKFSPSGLQAWIESRTVKPLK